MRTLLHRLKVWLLSFLAVVLIFVVLGPVQHVLSLAAIQNAVQRDWEISFGWSTGSDKPAFLPAWLDEAADDFFTRILGYTHGDTNRDIVYRERFRAFFRGPIEDAHIYDFEGFRGDLGAALTRLPRLRRVTAYSMREADSESEWTQLCTHLRTLPQLEELDIGGHQLTDRAVAPLAGAPQLRILRINCDPLTPSSARTFASMPRLMELRLESQKFAGSAWPPEEEAAWTAALPKVHIVFQ